MSHKITVFYQMFLYEDNIIRVTCKNYIYYLYYPVCLFRLNDYDGTFTGFNFSCYMVADDIIKISKGHNKKLNIGPRNISYL